MPPASDCTYSCFSCSHLYFCSLILIQIIFYPAVQDDRSLQLLELRKLLNRLPKTNFVLLEFIFHHLLRWGTKKDRQRHTKKYFLCKYYIILFFSTIMSKLLAFRVAERSKDNCMNSKNLAVCWRPTILRYEYADLNTYEAMVPHMVEIVQTMIDQFSFLFRDGEVVTRAWYYSRVCATSEGMGKWFSWWK